MAKPREKTREELTTEIEDGKKKIRQLKTGKRCCGKSCPKRNAGRAATGWSSEAQSLRALCRKPRP